MVWRSKYDKACVRMENREQGIRDVIDLLERDMEFLGITGIEDKLQDQVYLTIESLRQAGIKV